MTARVHDIGQARQDPAAPDPAFLHDLAAAESHAWWLLEQGVVDRHSPMHVPSVATLSADGPQVRSVTLRHTDRVKGVLRFHADARGGLVAQLQADPRAALHAYHPAENTQLRLVTRAELHRGDGLAAAAWHVTNPSAKRCYLVPPPGSASALPASGLPPDLERRRPTAAESDAGFLQFCVVELTVDAFDWLHVHAIHKRRARFERHDGRWRGTWLTP